MKLVIIAAHGPRMELGYQNRLPWDFHSEMAKEDMALFKEKTSEPNTAILMGRKTFESIPESKTTGERLPGRKIIVLSSTMPLGPKGNTWVTRDFDMDLRECLKRTGIHKVYIAGGASIYKMFLNDPELHEMHLTRMDGKFKADTFFPAFDPKAFKSVEYKELNKMSDLMVFSNRDFSIPACL